MIALMSHTASEGLTNGTRYLFEVRAVNGVGKGVSAQVKATPGSGPGVPPAPTSGLTASPGGPGMDVAWAAVSATPAVTGYRLRSQWAGVGTQAWSTYDTVATPRGRTRCGYPHWLGVDRELAGQLVDRPSLTQGLHLGPWP